MKRILTLLIAAAACAAGYAAGPVTAAKYYASHVNDWPAILAAREAGGIELTGKFRDDMPVYTAQWYAQKLDDAALYAQVETDLASFTPHYESCGVTLFRLGARAENEAIRAAATDKLKSWLEAEGERSRVANYYLPKIYAHPNVRNFAAIIELLKQGQGNGYVAKTAAANLLKSGDIAPAAIYGAMAAGLPELARLRCTAQDIPGLVNSLCAAAKRADVPDAAVYEVLRSVYREICDKAVGTDDNAKKWGIAVGKISIKMDTYKK